MPSGHGEPTEAEELEARQPLLAGASDESQNQGEGPSSPPDTQAQGQGKDVQQPRDGETNQARVQASLVLQPPEQVQPQGQSLQALPPSRAEGVCIGEPVRTTLGNRLSVFNNVHQVHPWSTSIFECFEDIPTCVVGCFCPCIVYGQNVRRMSGEDSCFASLKYYCVGLFIPSLLLHISVPASVLPYVAWISVPCLIASKTCTELRLKYGLEEGPLSDTLMHFPILTYCSLCQEAREIEKRQLAQWVDSTSLNHRQDGLHG